MYLGSSNLLNVIESKLPSRQLSVVIPYFTEVIAKSASVGLHDFLNVIAVVVYPVYLCLIDVNEAHCMYVWTAPKSGTTQLSILIGNELIVKGYISSA